MGEETTTIKATEDEVGDVEVVTISSEAPQEETTGPVYEDFGEEVEGGMETTTTPLIPDVESRFGDKETTTSSAVETTDSGAGVVSDKSTTTEESQQSTESSEIAESEEPELSISTSTAAS